VVILGHGTLALKDLDGDGVLIVSGSRENLRLLGGDDSVAANELSHDSSDCLNTHGQGVDVKQDNVVQTLLGT